MSKRYRNNMARLLTAGALAGICSSAWASGFQLMEQSSRLLGTAYAGTASQADDATTGFYNSAGLTRLPQEQVAVSAIGIALRSNLTVDRAVGPAGAVFLNTPSLNRMRTQAFIPSGHYVFRCDNWAFGLNVVSPFGLKTHYNADSDVRLMSTLTELRTYDIAPSVAYNFGNGLSIGAGPDFVHAFAQLDSTIGTGFVGLAPEGYRSDKASRWGIGGHVGLLYEISDCTRIGVNYRSQVRIDARGRSEQLLPVAFGGTGVISSDTIRARVTLPDTAVVSAFHQFNDCWAVMADAQWTHWSKFKELSVVRGDGQRLSVTQNFRDTYRVALGTSYRWDDCWTLRLGGAYDRSPVRDAYRNSRIPDSDRTWAAIGARYNITNCLALDAGYSRIFFKKAEIHERAPTITPGPISTAIDGRYRSNADVFGLQLTWDIT